MPSLTVTENHQTVETNLGRHLKMGFSWELGWELGLYQVNLDSVLELFGTQNRYSCTGILLAKELVRF